MDSGRPHSGRGNIGKGAGISLESGGGRGRVSIAITRLPDTLFNSAVSNFI